MDHTPNSIAEEIAVAVHRELSFPFKLLIMQKVDNWRTRLIRNSLERKPADGKFFMQTLFVKMERVSPVPGCIETPDICPIARSVDKLPSPLRYGNQLFDFVGSIDGTTAFKFSPAGMGQYINAGKYSKNIVPYGWINKKIEVYNYPNLPYIKVTAVFEDPMKVMELNCENGMNCDYWDQFYPCTKDILQQAIQYSVSELKGEPISNNKSIEVTAEKQTHEPDGR